MTQSLDGERLYALLPAVFRLRDAAHGEPLRALLSAVPVDAINTMGIPPDDPYAKHGEPPAWAEYGQIAGQAGLSQTIEPISKWDFYKAVESPDHILTVQTADQALWANLLLTVGCRTS